MIEQRTPARSWYLDHAATTPCLPTVVEAMAPYWNEIYANPSNRFHLPGRRASEAVERARSQVAAGIGARSSEIIWTSGITEANNLAILGHISKSRSQNEAKNPLHAITVASEHKSVLSVFGALRAKGVEVTVLAPDKSGGIEIERIVSAFRENTVLVSVMWANNELGTINPVQSIATECRRRGIAFHTDAAQVIGKLTIDVGVSGASFVSIGAHKIGGPKGIGALYVRDLFDSHSIEPILFGGGQEEGLRSGTLNVPAIVGFGAAVSHVSAGMETASRLLASKRDELEVKITGNVHGSHVNAERVSRVPHISSITLPIRDGVDVIEKLSRVACSTGSACSTHDGQPSHVLNSIGIRGQEARNTLRLSVGWNTSDEDVHEAAEEVIAVAKQFGRNC